MCCRLLVSPLDREVAQTVLAVGLFRPQGWDEERPIQEAFTLSGLTWQRFVEEESTTVKATLENDSLRLELAPSISAYIHHANKRISGGIYFEIAAKYAEKVDGKITQLSNVAGCTENGSYQRVLAQYPDEPMCWEQICAGFRETILGQEPAA